MTVTEPIAEELNHRVLIETADGLQAIGKNGTGPGEFRYPSAVAVFEERIYVADSWNHRVQVFSLNSLEFEFEFGGLGTAPGRFFCPRGIVIIETRKHGRVLCVVDSNNNRICFHMADGRCVNVFYLGGRRFPVGISSVDPARVEVRYEDGKAELFEIESLSSPRDAIVADWLALQGKTGLTYDEKYQANRRVLERLDRAEREALGVLPAGRLVTGKWNSSFGKPISLVCDAAGAFYVSDFGRCNIRKFDSQGTEILEVLPAGRLSSPGKMAILDKRLFVTDGAANRIAICDCETGEIRDWNCPIDRPGVIATDGTNIWLASYDPRVDAAYRSIHVFDASLRLTKTIDVEGLQRPTSIAVSGDRVFIGDEAACSMFVMGLDGSPISIFGREVFCAPVWALRADPSGGVWAGTGRKLYYFNSNMELGAEVYADGASATGSVVDVAFSKPGTVHFIDFERAAVRWMERETFGGIS